MTDKKSLPQTQEHDGPIGYTPDVAVCSVCKKSTETVKMFASLSGLHDDVNIMIWVCSEPCYSKTKTDEYTELIGGVLACMKCGRRRVKEYDFITKSGSLIEIQVTCSKSCRDKIEATSTCSVCSKKLRTHYCALRGNDPNDAGASKLLFACSEECEEKMGIGNLYEQLSCTQCSARADKKFNVGMSSITRVTKIVIVHCSMSCASKTAQDVNAPLYQHKAVIGKICAKCKSFKAPEKHRVCARCKEVYYCTKECQVAHWPAHKASCKKKESEGDRKSDNNKDEKPEEVD